MPNDRDPDPHVRSVHSDRLMSEYVISAWLQLFVCLFVLFVCLFVLPEQEKVFE